MINSPSVTSSVGDSLVRRASRAVLAGLKFILWRAFVMCGIVYAAAALLSFGGSAVAFAVAPARDAMAPCGVANTVEVFFNARCVEFTRRQQSGPSDAVPVRSAWRFPSAEHWPTILGWEAWRVPEGSDWTVASNVLVLPALMLPWLVLGLLRYRAARHAHQRPSRACDTESKLSPAAGPDTDHVSRYQLDPLSACLVALLLLAGLSYVYDLRSSLYDDVWNGHLNVQRGWVGCTLSEHDGGFWTIRAVPMSEQWGLPGVIKYEGGTLGPHNREYRLSGSIWLLVALVALPWGAYVLARIRSAVWRMRNSHAAAPNLSAPDP